MNIARFLYIALYSTAYALTHSLIRSFAYSVNAFSERNLLITFGFSNGHTHTHISLAK